MRTSRISRDTAKVLASLSRSRRPAPPSHSSGSSPTTKTNSTTMPPAHETPSAPAQNQIDPADVAVHPHESDSDLSSVPSNFSADDQFAAAARSKKRKRGQDGPRGEAVVRTRSANRGAARAGSAVVKTEAETEVALIDTSKPKKARRAPAKKIVATNGSVSIEPPPNWEKVYSVTKEMRKSLVAPVDTMGCERLAEPNATPRDQRFQTLIALMLSSQTKDTVTAVAMKNMQQNLPGGLTLETILSIEPDVLNSFIEKVGFHNNKTKYIKQAAQILKDKFNSDIPDTIEGLVSLPGVGPKMAYLCMSAAWGRDEGIGVDVHVHRITNLWGWHKTKTPEETRATLEAWLPREKWHDINTLLVGFGQTLCLPVGRKCGDCALAEEGLCPSAIVGKKVTVKKEKTVKEELEGDMKIKVEEQTENIKDEPITVDSIPTGGVVDIEDIGSGMPSRRRSRRVKGA